MNQSFVVGRDGGNGGSDYNQSDEGTTELDRVMEQIEQMEHVFQKVLITEATISTLLNLIVIFIYFRLGKPRKNFPNFVLLCTAFSDTFVSASAWTFCISKTTQVIPYSFAAVCFDYSFALCLGTLLLGALDRMLSVFNPIKHRNIMLKPKITCVILIVWVFPFIPAAIAAAMGVETPTLYGYCYESICIFFILLIIAILTATWCKVSRVIRHPMPGSTVVILSMHKKNARVIKIFIGMIVAFAISFVPIPTLTLLLNVDKLSHLSPIEMLSMGWASHLLYFGSSAVNPLITLSLKEDYKKGFIRMLKCNWTKRTYVERRQRQLRWWQKTPR